MGHLQGFGNLGGRPQGLGVGERSGLERVAKGLARDVLHSEVKLALGLADLVDAADIGMVERRGRLGLAHEAGPHGRVTVGRFRQELEGDFAIETRVLGQIDFAHAALAELPEDGVFAGQSPAGGPFVRSLRGGQRLRDLGIGGSGGPVERRSTVRAEPRIILVEVLTLGTMHGPDPLAWMA